MAECPHGLDDRWCATCLHGPERRPEPAHVVARFPARYDGQCPVCDLPIGFGEPIAKMSDERYVHSPECEL
ncbi:MAG: hypothetical protein ACRDYZ_07910 [Acidimicrobiales bacterium]